MQKTGSHLRFFFLLPALLCWACLKEPPDPGTRGNRVVILLEAAPRELDPRLAGDGPSTKVSKLIFCALTTVETPDLVPRLDAASRVEPACPESELAACTHWEVQLRDDIYWHDGVQVLPEDVVFTFRSILESDLSSPFRGALQQKIEKVWEDNGVVHFQLTMPVASFPLDLAIGLVPRHILEPAGGLGGRFSDNYVGCGPFVFVARHGAQKVVLARNDLYPTPVTPEYVVVRTVTDESTRVLSVMAGSSDILVNNLSPPVVRTLEDDPRLEVLHHEAASVTYMSFNLLDPRLADVRVRQAIAHGIDRKTLVDQQFYGMARTATGILPPMHWAYTPDVKLYPYDTQRARGLLEEAGFPPDPETGVRLQLTLKVTTDRFRRNIGALVAHHLSDIGIQVQLVPLELSTFLADVRMGNYEMYILQAPEVLEPDILRWFFHSRAVPVLTPQRDKSRYGQVDRTLFPPHFKEVSGPFEQLCRARWFPEVYRQAHDNWLKTVFAFPSNIANGNRSFYYDPTVDCLLHLGFTTLDRTERVAMYHEIQKMIARQIPVLSLWHEDNVAVVRREIEGYRLLPINRFSPVASVRIAPR